MSSHALAGTPSRAVMQNFSAASAHKAVLTAGLLQLLPLLAGAFTGAPLLAREFENGTFRFAWTQGFGRTRWTIAKLVPLVLVVVAASLAFSALFSWFFHPIIRAGGDSDSNGLAATIFDLRGIELAAWALLALALGVLAGVVIRRVVPALTATFVVWIAVAFLTGAVLRPQYEPPLVTHHQSIPRSALILDQWWTFHGGHATLAMLNQALEPIGVRAMRPDVFVRGASPSGRAPDPISYLRSHGYELATSYQPASRFWTWQLIEGGWLLALSVTLVGASVWLVHRRAT